MQDNLPLSRPDSIPFHSGAGGVLRRSLARGSRTLAAPLSILAVAMIVLPLASTAQGLRLATLELDTATLSNVVIVGSSPRGIILRHSGGGGVVPLDRFPKELQERLSRDTKPGAPGSLPRLSPVLAVPASQPLVDPRRHFLVERQNRIEGQLAALRAELSRLDRVIPDLSRRARGMGRRSGERADANRTRERRIGIVNRIHQLESDLDRLRNQLLALP